MPGWRLPSPSWTQTLSPSRKPCSIASSLIGRSLFARARAESSQLAPVLPHRGVAPVAVGLVAQAGDQLVVVAGGEALGVADHVVDANPEAAAQPLGEAQRGAQLGSVAEHVPVAVADVLDPERGPVEADRVAAAGAEVDEAEDPARAGDYEVRA